MKVTKLGHCCFVAEPKDGIRVMTDPGAFSTLQNEEKNISAVLITHEHQDHLHIESLKKVLENNPKALVITNASVGKLLDEAGIKYIKLEEGGKHDLGGVDISGFGNVHAEIYGIYGQVQNTGYMIDGLCYPGDAFSYPDAKVDILALPVAGPWMKLKEAIDYSKNVNPRVAFPVHDAILSSFTSFVPKIVDHFLQEQGVVLKVLELGKEEIL